jgi:hypothetical protein
LLFLDAKEGSMDATQMMMASGGILSILISLLMMLLPLILLLIAWRILKWTSSTAHQVTRLTEQMDELLRHLQGTQVSHSENDFILKTSKNPEDTTDQTEDDFDILAAAPAPAAADEMEDLAVADPFAAETESGESGFEFPADDDETLGDLHMGDELPEPAAGNMDTALGGRDEAFGDTGGFDFGLDDLEAGGESLGSLETTESKDEDLSGKTSESREPLADAFDTDETYADNESAGQAADEDRQPEDSFDSAFTTGAEDPAEETPAEPPPAIIQLADDPARPDVSLARCGQCDHKLAYKKTLAGKKARCPSCKSAFVLP